MSPMPNMPRRDFLKTAPVAAGVAASVLSGAGRASASPTRSSLPRGPLRSFDLEGVRLLESRFKAQYDSAREFYFGVPDDDILHGFRAEAGLPAPGKVLGGWADQNSGVVFGQWLSGMARMYRATGDAAMRDKALHLMREWEKTLGPDGDARMRHYTYEKLVCGLVDLDQYGDAPEAMELLARVTAWASRALHAEPVPAVRGVQGQASGQPGEYYTLAENLYRAYLNSDHPEFKTFGDVWLYHPYWRKFLDTTSPEDAYGRHAYSHVNSFSSLAMAYQVDGDPDDLQSLRNAYDWLQNTQCWATGGFGPGERLMPANGNLGRALEVQPKSFETPCGSWAGLKMSRYLIEATGEARYGDWAERLVYNGIGSALWIRSRAGITQAFYPADYSLWGAVKVYHRAPYHCCAGSYIQAVTEYHNQIYYQGEGGLYVNLFMPSEVTWAGPDGEVRLVQETDYPERETTTLTLGMERRATFPLSFRVPGWSRDVSVRLNGTPLRVDTTPGTWATVERSWEPDDRVEIRIPLHLRYQAVDAQHPQRVAIVRGPVVMVQDANANEIIYGLPDREEDLARWLVPEEEQGPAVFRHVPPDGSYVDSRFRPFYAVGESSYYRMYSDLDERPVSLFL